MQVRELTAREDDLTITEILKEQHPVINTWLVLSSLSIFFMSALFFIFP